MLTVTLAGAGTALITGLGAVPVFLIGHRAEALRPMLYGIAAGVMSVASIVGLLRPALERSSATPVAGGLVCGVLFLLAARRLLQASDLHVGRLRGADVRTAVLVFAVLFAHSLPAGLAIGTAYASDPAGIGVFVILAIAIQNIPEGTSVAIPMKASGFGPAQQFWAAVGTSAPQPIRALIAFVAVEQVTALLPFSFAFAAGAMLALVAAELAPPAVAGGWRGIAGLAGGAALMLGLSALLNV